MTIQTIYLILLSVVILIGVIAAGYVYFRNTSVEQIREDVYQLFLKAEHMYTETKAGKQKMAWVISKARGLLPKWLQAIVTDEFLHKVFEMWFQAVKDLLDDGKINKSIKEE